MDVDEAMRQASVLVRVRGALAVPSDNEDDRWLRVILEAADGGAEHPWPPALGGADVLGEPGGPAIEADLEAYVKEHGRVPDTVVVSGKAYAVFREAPTCCRPLCGKVALVTGAAGAIGAGVCQGLLARGARVAATDLNQAGLDALVADLGRDAPDRVIGVQMDVTDKASVAAAFEAVALRWGGVDVVVVNAGIALVARLTEMALEDFQRLERVNVEGALLTLAEAGRVLGRQGTGGDIVVVSTKNVFAPGAQFGAYSATKAACHQLARIASLEMAEFDVRVNMVAPDAVFSDGTRRSGLWAEVGPSRMKARGLDEQGLEDYYRDRNLLKARVTPAHVANAVAFFVTRQTPTTGATIPIDGGLPDATPR